MSVVTVLGTRDVAAREREELWEASATIRATIRVTDPHGLHTRPAAFCLWAVLDLDACFTVSANGRTITGSRLLPFPALSCGVLRARQGDELTITATGPDAEEGLEAIRRVLAAGTRFPDNRRDYWGTKNLNKRGGA